MKRIQVAIGIITRQGQILICQRESNNALGDFWEFPGGKCEPGESPHDCLLREIREEVDLVVEIVEPLAKIQHDYPHASITLHPFLCRHVSGEARALASQRILWVRPDELREHQFPPANATLLAEIISRFTDRTGGVSCSS
jgi:mutator protein MutT